MAQMPKIKVDFEFGNDAQRVLRLAEGALGAMKGQVETDLLRSETEKRVHAEKTARELSREATELRQKLEQAEVRAETAERQSKNYAQQLMHRSAPELEQSRRLLRDAQDQQRADEVTIRDLTARVKQLEEALRISEQEHEQNRVQAGRIPAEQPVPGHGTEEARRQGCICGTGGYPSPCPVHDPGRVGS